VLSLEKMTKHKFFAISDVPNDPEGGSTPPPAPGTVADTKTSSSKGKEVPSAVHEEHGYVLLWPK
jgi:hypothetical protein